MPYSLSASSLLNGVGGGLLPAGGGANVAASSKSATSAAETSRKHLPRLISLARKFCLFPLVVGRIAVGFHFF